MTDFISIDFHSTYFGLLLIFTIRGLLCEPIVKPIGSSVVKTQVGSNETLRMTYSGVTTPQVSWWKDGVSIAVWTIGSTTPPQIVLQYEDVLVLEEDGSLSFINVALKHGGKYSITVVGVGAEEGKTSFTLIVYDKIEGVTLQAGPKDAVEGDDTFTLYYTTLKGEAEFAQWFFNGEELRNSSHHSMSEKNLSIIRPSREDTGQYNITLRNPFSFGTSIRNLTVLYGPDQPTLDVSPTKSFFVSGESLSLSCGAQGEPLPSVSWAFNGQAVPSTRPGTLQITNAQTNQSGAYTCMLKNDKTESQVNKSVTVNVYESPAGSPVCSVHAADGNLALHYRCEWPGGTPEAQLTFPALSTASMGLGELNLTVDDPLDLDGMEVSCLAHHPVHQKQCNITARKTAGFLPSVSAMVDADGRVVVVIGCVAEATPNATVIWARSGQDVTSLTGYEVSDDTAWLRIGNFNVSTAGLHTYTCTAVNPLGSHSRDTVLSGPAISDASLFPNEEGTVITLTWEVPSTSIVTGFDIQVKGPDLPHSSTTTTTVSHSQRAKTEYRTIMVRPGDSRSADISGLDPKSRYNFRVIPKAGRRAGKQSQQLPTGPGGGLSGAAIAGIAAGIPCSLLVLLLLCLIFPCVFYHKKRSRKARYPVSRAVEKAVTTMSTPHQLLTGGLKLPPDYSNHQPPAIERSAPLPSVAPAVRMATTV
ncbi:hypothetical protein ACEWY4_019587 [Coilia grayii]|uniref:Ig-like domain-containing protein n=1 Tax=Coilia grayii TaxID=363190 RepID=A0ABD1JBC4_9TELE